MFIKINSKLNIFKSVQKNPHIFQWSIESLLIWLHKGLWRLAVLTISQGLVVHDREKLSFFSFFLTKSSFEITYAKLKRHWQTLNADLWLWHYAFKISKFPVFIYQYVKICINRIIFNILFPWYILISLGKNGWIKFILYWKYRKQFNL